MKLIELEAMLLVNVEGLPGSTTRFRAAATMWEPLILELRSGMTAGDLLAEANLAHCTLARPVEPGTCIPREEALDHLMADCETLFLKIGGV